MADENYRYVDIPIFTRGTSFNATASAAGNQFAIGHAVRWHRLGSINSMRLVFGFVQAPVDAPGLGIQMRTTLVETFIPRSPWLQEHFDVGIGTTDWHPVPEIVWGLDQDRIFQFYLWADGLETVGVTLLTLQIK